MRNDVFRDVRQLHQYAFSCKQIDTVQNQITNGKKINGLWVIDEIWTVHACQQNHQYAIQLREDNQGETDYNIHLIQPSNH